MDSIRHLLPQDGREIFDPEKMTIEILACRLHALVDGDYLNVLHLGPMRAMAREVAGQPKEDDPDGPPLPEALSRLHCIHYDRLSPVNRRQCFRLVLGYLGLTEASGGELLGHDRWQRLMQGIEVKCGGVQAPGASEGRAASESATTGTIPPAASRPWPSGSAEPAIEEVATVQLDEWSRQALMAKLLQLLDADGFDLYGFDRLGGGLVKAREYLSLPPHDASKTPQYVGLGLVRLCSYAEIDKSVRAGLPAAILEALALDDDSGPRILGIPRWQQVESRYAAGIAEAENKAGDDAMIVSRAPTRRGPGPVFLAASMLGALIGSIILVASRMDPPRGVSTWVSPVRAAPTTSPLGDEIPALPENRQEASSETLQPFMPPPGGDAGDVQQRP